jgi:beta-glucosidase
MGAADFSIDFLYTLFTLKLPNIMKSLVLFFIFILTGFKHQAQEHPFQNPGLPDEERLDNLISLMTTEEKVAMLSTRLSIPRLGIKGTRTVEGLHGLAFSGPANWAVRGTGSAPTTTFPQSIGLAQMWDPELLVQIASLEAEEARFLAQNKQYGRAGLIVFAPNADMGRDIRWGRTEECYGEDPFLTGVLTTAYVQGLQGSHPRYWKTASLMKHFLANSNENNRMVNSSDFDERLFREYYAWPFYKGITEGGSRALMTAYNKYNGIPCTVHPVLRNVIVNEWGNNGIIATDGGAYRRLVSDHHYFPDLKTAAVACIKAGTTMFLDNYREYVTAAVEEGLIPVEALDLAIRGNLRILLKLGLLDGEHDHPYSGIGILDTIPPWTKPENHALVRKATTRSVVLLKNDGKLLPLRKEKFRSIAVIGPRADLVVSDWYAGTPPYVVTALQGIRNQAGDSAEVRFCMSNKADSAVILAARSDVAIVFVGNHPLSYHLGWGQNQVPSDGREDVDRQAISLEQEDLVKLVLAANPKTILIMISSFPYAINWSKENVPAILHITQSSQELGNGLADVIFGKVSPSGRLVQTWSSSIDHLPPILDYNIRNGRTYMYDKHVPLFPFGYGLTYTTFNYSGLRVSPGYAKEGDVLQISLQVTNSGNYDSDEVVQLYASFPDSGVERPQSALKAFKRVFIPAGKSVTVNLPLRTDDLKYWNSITGTFQLESGRVDFFIGGSSVDKRLNGSFILK